MCDIGLIVIDWSYIEDENTLHKIIWSPCIHKSQHKTTGPIECTFIYSNLRNI